MANFKNFKTNLRRLAEDYMDDEESVDETYLFDEFDEEQKPKKDRQVNVEQANNVRKDSK